MKQTTYNLHINNIERREALKTFTDLGLVSIAGSLGLSYVWNNHKDSSVIESNIANHEVIKHSIHTESKPYFMLYPRTTLLLSSSLIYNLSHLFTLLKLNTPFIILLDSLHTPLLETLQDIKDNLEYINERYIYKDIESKLDSIIQTLHNHNTLFYIHNPSIAGFVQDKDLAREHTLKMLKKYVCGNKYSRVLPLNAFHTRTDSIFKEAYCKVLCYLDLATDEHVTYLCTRIPNATKESITKLFNSQTLMDTTNLIKTKIKIDPSQSNDDKNFITSRAMSYSRDFLIQLKRVAEYNYLVYSGSIDDSLNRKSPTKREVEMLGSLIYDKGFIPTTIDVRD
ncbi:hypothetical protein [Helicobacter trogontum]|uniref:Uncharacterized protein n=1 Tax=Helicobacter trogontum TaxID=50960 RepID=A0A4U8S282_9HELI|nr:hypothetical protein [Helicobacter trogontum]TLD79696.1 hypothetical protein LS81_010435 [Helicobacter trogontum]